MSLKRFAAHGPMIEQSDGGRYVRFDDIKGDLMDAQKWRNVKHIADEAPELTVKTVVEVVDQETVLKGDK